MNKTCNGRYLGIPKKKDIGTNISIRNRFTYYPLYNVGKNSYIRRYQLWMKYRDKCIKNGVDFVDVKQYGKILNAISQEISRELSKDPDGVIFKNFKIKALLSYRNIPVLEIKSKLKKKTTFSIKNWGLLPNRILKDKLKKLYKTNQLVNFGKKKCYHFKTIADKLDIFDEF